MEKLNIFETADGVVVDFATSGCGCAHCVREHTLIYVLSGLLEVTEQGHTQRYGAGTCAFLRRDNSLWFQKHATPDVPFRCLTIKFSSALLKQFYHDLDKSAFPTSPLHSDSSFHLLSTHRVDVEQLFQRTLQLFEAPHRPSDEALHQHLLSAIETVLATDANLYASLFDFVDAWKIDLLAFMEKNYREDLSMKEMAHFTGRSLSTFKRDFSKHSNLTPQRWIMQRRLHAARELIAKGGRNVTEVCFEVGFKNLSHFSKAYKEAYGVSPTATTPI